MAAWFFDATDISPMLSGLDASNPSRKGEDISGMLAATAVDLVADAEKVEGKNKTFVVHKDLWSQSKECNDHKAITYVCASLNRTPRSGPLDQEF